MKHELPEIGYEYSALEPFIDQETMKIHHTKHHQAYVDKLNSALEKFSELQEKQISELLQDNLKIVPEEIKTAVKNNGGGHFNHSFFWSILSPEKQQPSDELMKLIQESFESFDNFKEQFKNSALTRFGSGWVWLVLNQEKLEVYSTANQDSPVMENKIPLLALDLWEHAYYLKYQNKRADYVEAFWNIINWQQVEKLLKSKDL